ncbi:conserved hypothetical protein [Bordetella bronchiseptica Bbr77]|nr:conserved hypothetical protein [Bordetella bronchiseptica Bbr77]
MGGPYIGIVADDLTGSGDTAVQFVRAGWATQLSVGGAEQALADPAVRQAEVLAVTTHSRPLAAADAAAVVRGEVERLRAAGVQRLYKKVDSTLRGAFKAEIDAARLAWGEDAIAVVCPAFPVTGRTVRQGVLYVGDRPVTETSAATDPVTPVTESHIPTLLGCAQLAAQAGETPAELARRIAAAAPVVVVDALDDADVQRLARAIGVLGQRAVPVGSGGLAAAGVVATGGDGASAVLAALQASGIALVDEVTGGVPLGTLTGGQAAGLPVVTKAGGFGEQDVLIRAAQAIRERRFTK